MAMANSARAARYHAHGVQHRAAAASHIGAAGRQAQRLQYRRIGDVRLLGAVFRHVHVHFPHMRIDQPQQGDDVALVEAKRLLEKSRALCAASTGICSFSTADRAWRGPWNRRSRPCARRAGSPPRQARRHPGEPGGDLVLHVEEIGARLVKTLGPEMRARFRIKELGIEAHAIGGANASFRHSARQARGRAARDRSPCPCRKKPSRARSRRHPGCAKCRSSGSR